ncbi:hypothetical protein [Flaviaesturariibacter amylovorans]|uniref:Uncharacterized protein n=1 Tax=Flaviaesturariibacter amylovorans TaxID=1084520 RepID=A0ABP8HG98_9BACT
MRLLIFLLTLMLSSQATAQDLSGTWEGRGSIGMRYVKMVLVRAGDKYVGYTYDESGGGFCQVNFEGSFDVSKQRLKGSGQGVIRKTFDHSQSSFVLYYSASGGREWLTGSAHARGALMQALSFGAGISVTLSRSSRQADSTVFMRNAIAAAARTSDPPAVAATETPVAVMTAPEPTPAAAAPPILPDSTAALLALRSARRTDTMQVIDTDAPEITIRVFDNGVFDGDTVSILHNDRVVADHQAVRPEPIVFRIALADTASAQAVTLIAHNEGRIPPNSALVVIDAGGRQYRITAHTDARRNALVLVRRR